jgi:hypothetical protein
VPASASPAELVVVPVFVDESRVRDDIAVNDYATEIFCEVAFCVMPETIAARGVMHARSTVPGSVDAVESVVDDDVVADN